MNSNHNQPQKCSQFILLSMFLLINSAFCAYNQEQILSDNIYDYSAILTHSSNIRDTISSNSQSRLIESLKFTFKAETQHQIDIQFNDADDINRFSMPKIDPFNTLFRDFNSSQPASISADITLEITKSPFSFILKRKSTDEEIFSSSRSLYFSDIYMQYSSIIPTNDIFGLGERNYMNLKLKQGRYTLNAKDQLYQIEDGVSSGKGVYSSHPVYLVREKSGNFNVVFYKNPTPTDVIISKNQIEFKSVGGIIHFKVFIGDKNPETAIKLYHNYLGGGHALPPFWAFGFHQSRWGYKTSDDLERVITSYRKHEIPLDTIWTDIDVMIDKIGFTVDEERFPEDFFKNLHTHHKVRYVTIVDVGVSVESKQIAGKEVNQALLIGKQMDIFCRSPNTGKRLKGRVWPGVSYFPDFFHPNALEYMQEVLDPLQESLKYSGLWIDMNEPSNFCDNECTDKEALKYQDIDDKPDLDYINQPYSFVYTPGRSPLGKNTLPPHMLHYGGYSHKDVHNLYGLMESYLTFQTLSKSGKFVYPFILTRSSFPGSGRFSFKWTGDNVSSFEYLQLSIPSIVNMNIFGLPFAGADICGFMQNTTPELCSRWIQLGSLYPFARNHNQDVAKSQELYAFGDGLIKTSIAALRLRYSILKHYYMLFVRLNHSGTVFRPLFFEFSEDANCYSEYVLNKQFMIGSELMVTPSVVVSQKLINPYFPAGNWYDLQSGFKVKTHSRDGQFLTIFNDLTESAPIFIRAGKLLGYQNSKNVQTIEDLSNVYKLICALSDDDSSEDAEKNQGDQYFPKQTCKGQILNLSSSVTEEEVKQQCDKEHNKKSNCLLSISITLSVVDDDKKRFQLSFETHPYSYEVDQDNGQSDLGELLINSTISIHSIILYNFPQMHLPDQPLQLDSVSNSQQFIELSRFNYEYNVRLQFSKQFFLAEKSSFAVKF